jgi:hypothetical protein
MDIKSIEPQPKGTVEVTYRCGPCGFETKRIMKAGEK